MIRLKILIMVTADEKLKERIKELTCLYEVTSIIVNSDYDQLQTSLEAIAYSLKRAWQFEKHASVNLNVCGYKVSTDSSAQEIISVKSAVKVFNVKEGFIEVGYPAKQFTKTDILDEEKKLLKNVCLEVGNLLERKQIWENEKTIRRQMERTDRLHILGEITAGIAHELNTPLANILGFAELLKEKMTDSKLEKDLDKIVGNAIFSREVVKKLMFFACEMPQQMEVIDLVPVVKDVLNLLNPAFKKKEITCSQFFNKEVIKLKADNIQLTQVLFNLVMNAVYFSPDKGNIDIRINDTEKNVQIIITDEGPGIDKKHGDKIFEPFFTTKPIGEGSGLGLSVVHGIISSHKGKIIYKPNSPRGTIFIVDFPKL